MWTLEVIYSHCFLTDNALAGINQYESDKPARYINNTNLSSRVANLNPAWNGDQSEQASNSQFQKAMQLTGQEFMEALEYYSKVTVFQRTIFGASSILSVGKAKQRYMSFASDATNGRCCNSNI